jgi:hypothetical protein
MYFLELCYENTINNFLFLTIKNKEIRFQITTQTIHHNSLYSTIKELKVAVYVMIMP